MNWKGNYGAWEGRTAYKPDRKIPEKHGNDSYIPFSTQFHVLSFSKNLLPLSIKQEESLSKAAVKKKLEYSLFPPPSCTYATTEQIIRDIFSPFPRLLLPGKPVFCHHPSSSFLLQVLLPPKWTQMLTYIATLCSSQHEILRILIHRIWFSDFILPQHNKELLKMEAVRREKVHPFPTLHHSLKT